MTDLLTKALNEMMAVEMLARENQLYAAWRSDYDYLYVLSSFSMTDLSLEFIPSNDPDRRFPGQRIERYDLRDEVLSTQAREFLKEYRR